jgi:uncharacterized protein YjdB
MKRAISLLVLSFAILASCSGDALDPAGGTVESVVVSPSTSTVALGSSVDLNAQVIGVGGTAMLGRAVHWTSEDESIATVGSDGVVTTLRLGSTQVAASAGGRSGIAQVTVTTVPVGAVQVTPGNRDLLVEATFQFTAQVRDPNGGILTDRPVTWSSNNENVATVSATGLVTALAPGGAIITASAEGKSAPASVTVSAIPVATVLIKPATQALVVGQAAQMQAEPVDDAGNPLTGRVIQWTTTNASIATVTSTGLVTAHAPGTASIRATCEGIAGTAILSVTARPPNAVVVTPAQVLVQPGATSQLTVQVLDAAGSDIPGSTVTFSSADPAVASVTTGGLVTGVAAGNTTISATSAGKTGTAKVTVTPVPVGSVVVTPSAPAILVGRSVTLSAQALTASGQPINGRTVTWSSATPGVAQVTANGVVTGISAGTAVVFASIDGVLGWSNVRVVAPVTTVTITPVTLRLAPLTSGKLTAVVSDPGGVNPTATVTWATSNSLVAQVLQDGTVNARLPGTATISARAGSAIGTARVVVR